MIFHPLETEQQPPEQLNNPFDYEPHPLCVLAAEELTRYIYNKVEWTDEVSQGKMFGVLIVEKPDKSLGYIAAYSGQIGGRSDWEDFVPAVFDYLKPDGYFKTHEAEIVEIGQEIARLADTPERRNLKKEITRLHEEREEAISRHIQMMTAAKMLRDKRRQESFLSEQEQNELIRESQFQKAQLKRIRKGYLDEIGKKEQEAEQTNAKVRQLELLRREKSRSLQHWLFSHFLMLNAAGEKRSLIEIFAETAFKEPPAGAGECCEPKLLQYAFANQLRPLAIATFWFGGHPKSEIRHHGQFYPACAGKCKPILKWMLADMLKFPAPELPSVNEDFDPKKHAGRCGEVDILYEDKTIIVINKPADLLSIPGTETKYSVWKIFRDRYPNLDSPLLVHRLDMATSGILVLAKTHDAYVKLQQQFSDRTVNKRYAAILDGVPGPGIPRSGVISLPLRPNLFDRPRQVVDYENGKEAVTEYTIQEVANGWTRISLIPKTGRTHQLRMHCAHPDGLGLPIIGDVLYGRRADRLYLHAACIDFVHPKTGERLYFESEPPF